MCRTFFLIWFKQALMQWSARSVSAFFHRKFGGGWWLLIKNSLAIHQVLLTCSPINLCYCLYIIYLPQPSLAVNSTRGLRWTVPGMHWCVPWHFITLYFKALSYHTRNVLAHRFQRPVVQFLRVTNCFNTRALSCEALTACCWRGCNIIILWFPQHTFFLTFSSIFTNVTQGSVQSGLVYALRVMHKTPPTLGSFSLGVQGKSGHS